MGILDQHIVEIRKLCESNMVNSLFAFGSVTTDKFNLDSDIDLIIDINDDDPISYSEKYFNFKYRLQELLKRPIDLLELRAIRNRFFKQEIDKTKVLIYASSNKNMA